jgi:cyclin-A
MLRAIPFLSYTPSTLSAAAIALSYYTLGNSIWNSKMQNTFGYDLEELREVLINFNKLHIEAELMQQQAIQEKYKANKYLQVSCVKPATLTSEDIDNFISKLSIDDELNTTAENIESVRQKTEMLLN